jgi:hypothetical protein
VDAELNRTIEKSDWMWCSVRFLKI